MEDRYVMARTLGELKVSQATMLNAATVAFFLKIDHNRLLGYARTGQLDGMFPVFISGNRVKFPKQGFINFMEGK